MSNMQLQPVDKKKLSIQNFFNGKKAAEEMMKVLPKFVTPERMLRVFWTATIRNPKLLDCTQESLWESMMVLSQLGLEPDGRSAHLIPYGTQCTAIPDYKGYITRAQENGLHSIHYDNVFLNDVFDWFNDDKGLHYKHAPDWRKPDRGDYFASYVIWKEPGSDTLHGVIMPKADIDDIRAGSMGKNGPAWRDHYLEMAKKCPIRRAQKQWPIDVKMEQLRTEGKISTAAVDVESVVTTDDDQIPGAETPAALPAGQPAASEPPPAQTQQPAAASPETPAQTAQRMITEGVTFEGFVADVTARRLALNADSWADYNDVPQGVWDTLGGQPKAVADMMRKFPVAKKN